MEGVEKGFALLITAVLAVVIINLLLNVNYQSYAQSRNNLVTQYGATAGVVSNYTTTAGGLSQVLGNNILYVVGILLLIIVIVALVNAIRSGKLNNIMGGGSG